MGYELGNNAELVTGVANEAQMGQSRFKLSMKIVMTTENNCFLSQGG
jgi:hypothetical protein